MGKIVRLTESDLNRLVRQVIQEQATGGQKVTPQIVPSPQVIDYLTKNKITKGTYVVLDNMGTKMVHLQYLPPSSFGYSKFKTIVKIPVPAGLNKNTGNWTYSNGKISLI
jgi:hypothetical protein